MEKIVLSDELFSLYNNFHNQPNPKKSTRRTYDRLLENISLPIKTNATQIIRCKDSLNQKRYDELLAIYLPSDNKENLLELSQQTIYKLILSTDENMIELPYLNVKKQSLSKRYSITLNPNESRVNLRNYIASLLNNAKAVLICDNYFAENWNNTAKFFHLLPNKKFEINFVDTSENLAITKNSLKLTNNLIPNFWTDWSINRNTEDKYADRHDRYLIIDNKLEIMLSSGFDYLWKETKELSCIFKTH